MLKRGNTGLWLGIIVFFTILLLPANENLGLQGQKMAAVTLLMVVWWVTEAIPIYITSFIPIVLFPLLGILNSQETTANYGNNYVLMLLGAFILAKGIEKQNLHKRIALKTITLLGSSQRKIILAFMVVTAFLSLWITNMAVVLIMLPIANSIIDSNPEKDISDFSNAILLAIAYSASVGGTGTLIGTPPNLVFAGLFEKLYPQAPKISFVDWMKIAMPLVIILLPIIWIYIIKFFKIKKGDQLNLIMISREQTHIKKMTKGETRVMLLFIFTALGWVFRENIMIGEIIIPGWSEVLGVSKYVHDSTVAMFGAIALFLVGDGKGNKLMDWKTTITIPWGVAMFLGGGLALGAGFKISGLAEYLSGFFSIVDTLPGFLIILILVGLIMFITEINSNTATATIFLPVLVSVAVSSNINPLFLMIPATLACSFAFMLPTGTGTNTVIFTSERLSINIMMKVGFWLNLICIVLLTLILYYLILPLMNQTTTIPEWAM